MTDQNKQLFQTTEFHRYASATGLSLAEAFLITRFFEKHKTTLEAGTGGGRVLLALAEQGFTRLSGFDYVPAFIEHTTQKPAPVPLDLQVMDARHLQYPSETFDQALYLQQLLCDIEEEEGRRQAVEEAFRVLRPGGLALFSFLMLEARRNHVFYGLFLKYLGLLRSLLGSNRSMQYQPWLRRGGTPNLGALVDRPPYVYWLTVTDALELVRAAGFMVTHMATTSELDRGIVHTAPALLHPFEAEDQLYLVCRKPL